MFFSKRLRLITLVLILCVSTGCSFQLRGSYHIPKSLQMLQLTPDSNDYFSRTLKRQLKLHDVQLVDIHDVVEPSPTKKQKKKIYPILRIISHGSSESNLTVYADGNIAEYQLTYVVKFSIQQPKKEPKQYTIRVQRYYTNNPDFALAGGAEKGMTIKQMEAEAVQRVIQHLSIID
jgi:LPS-assembly lipoprotein